MRLKTKFIIIAVVLAIVAAVLTVNIWKTNKRTMAVTNSRKQIDTVLQGIFELNILTNDLNGKATLRARKQWQIKYGSLENELSRMLEELPFSSSRVNQIEDKIRSNYRLLGDFFNDIAQLSETSEPGKYRQDLIDNYQNRMTLGSVEIVYQAYDLHDAVIAQANAILKRHNQAVYLAVLVLVGLIFISLVIINYYTIRPLNKMILDMEIVGKGDLQHRLTVAHNNEIGDLATSFNYMTQNLAKVTASRDELNEEIHQRKQAEYEREQVLQRLAESNKQLENFAYVASHDLQEPLRKIHSFSSLLVRHLGDSLDEKGLRYFNYITSGATRMKQLISDLLEFSRISTRGKELQPVDLNNIVQAAMEGVSLAIDESNAQINISALPMVLGDDSQLRMVFHNLLTNAMKFRGEDDPKIAIEAKELDASWQISVRDNGIGIKEEYAERIFEIFQRLHSRDEYPGTGIGLALVKKVIERHNGRIWFTSKPGFGTTFYLEFPREGESNA